MNYNRFECKLAWGNKRRSKRDDILWARFKENKKFIMRIAGGGQACMKEIIFKEWKTLKLCMSNRHSHIYNAFKSYILHIKCIFHRWQVSKQKCWTYGSCIWRSSLACCAPAFFVHSFITTSFYNDDVCAIFIYVFQPPMSKHVYTMLPTNIITTLGIASLSCHAKDTIYWFFIFVIMA